MPSADLPIFLRLVADLFPGLDLPPKFDEDLKGKAVAVCDANNLQKEDVFLAKVVNFQELLELNVPTIVCVDQHEHSTRGGVVHVQLIHASCSDRLAELTCGHA